MECLHFNLWKEDEKSNIKGEISMQQPLCFQNKVAIVTGAGSGIGLATARAFAEAGAAVTLADINEKEANCATEKLVLAGHKALAVCCDVTEEKSVAVMIEKTIEVFGRLDIAYNNAGIHCPVAETADLSGEDFDRVIAVNLRGIWNCMKYELKVMRQQKGGVIVNCSSQSGIVGAAGLGAYTASKHGVIGLTKSAALEYVSRGIRINAICPGSTYTPLVEQALKNEPETMNAAIKEIPLGRLGQAEEIASTVLWLCSPGASFVIGQAIIVDGGYTIP